METALVTMPDLQGQREVIWSATWWNCRASQRVVALLAKMHVWKTKYVLICGLFVTSCVQYIYIHCKHSQASLPLSSYQAGLTSAVKVVALVVWVSPLLRLGRAVWSSCFAAFCMLLSKLFITFGYSIVCLNGLLALRILNQCVLGSPCSDMFRPNIYVVKL